MLQEHQINNHFKWIETTALTDDEKNKLLNEYHLPLEIMDYVTDVYERSNYIIDTVNELELVIVHLPTQLTKESRYISRPVCFLLRDTELFTFNEGESFIDFKELIDSLPDQSKLQASTVLLEALNHLVESYLPILRNISKERHRLDDMLTQRLSNRDLVRLSYLQQSLTFLLSASESNVDVLKQMRTTKLGKALNEEELERLDDALIEAKQVAHMSSLESGVVDKIAHIFDSIMNNNLNDTMKFLTVWSLALAIPTLITGFYGMNINLPRSGSSYEWLYLIILSIILIIWMILSLKRKRRM